jgi:hypothetical protein
MSDPFRVTVHGYYTEGPEVTRGDVFVTWKSSRPEKRLAELEVMRATFLDWYTRTKEYLTHD